MLKASHRGLAFALTPFFFKKIPEVHSTFPGIDHILNTIIHNYNVFFHSFTASTINTLNMMLFFLFYFIGSTFPDIDLKFKVFYKDPSKRYLYHRQFTHSILLSIIMLYVSFVWLYSINTTIASIFIGLTLGIITHQIGDMLTGSVPILFYGHYARRFSRFGITVFLPRSAHPVFTQKFPKWLNDRASTVFGLLFFLSTVLLYGLKHPLF